MSWIGYRDPAASDPLPEGVRDVDRVISVLVSFAIVTVSLEQQFQSYGQGA
jgi:hypothetical protein